MKVLLTLPTLQIGGADIFALRLALALSERHEVKVFVVHRRYIEPKLAAQLKSGGVDLKSPFHTGRLWGMLTYRLSRLSVKIAPGMDLISRLCAMTINRMGLRDKFDIINAHSMDSELIAAQAIKHLDIALVATDHGEYLIPECQRRLSLPGISELFQRTNQVILPSPSNLTASQKFPRNSGCRTHVIPYGYVPGNSQPAIRPEGAGIVFGLAARGIREKGWTEVVRAFAVAAPSLPPDSHLVLVGDLPFKQELISIIPSQLRDRVHFAGPTTDATPWISGFDCGLLPSYYTGETLPVFIIECLSSGCPVIATPQGGIAGMLMGSGGIAGALVPQEEGGPASISHLAEEMIRFATNATVRADWRNAARMAFGKFAMSTCVKSYQTVFEDCVAGQKTEGMPHSLNHGA